MKRLLFALLFIPSLISSLTPLCVHAKNSINEFDPRVQSHLREINYTVGDIAHQSIIIDTPLGYRLDTSTLPKIGNHRVIEVRSVQSSFQDEAGFTRHQLTIDWQVFMALREIRAVPLLDIDLQFLRAGKVLPVHIPASEIIVSPLLPTKMDKVHLVPQPDVVPQQLTLKPYIYTLVASSIGLLLSMIYFAWHAGWIRSRLDTGLPFRQAWQAMRQLRKQADHSTENVVRQAIALLSRAFDEYAEGVISTENLDQLFAKNPGLGKQQAAIIKFYTDMQYVFFAGGRPAHSLQELEKLARQLSRQQAA